MPRVRQVSSGRRESYSNIEPDSVPTPKRRLSVSECVAQVMLGRVVPNGDKRLRQRGVAIIVIVPAPQYVDPIAKAWRNAVANTRNIDPEEVLVGENADNISHRIDPNDYEAYFEIKRKGERSERSERSSGADANVAMVLAAGHTLIGFTTDQRLLPKSLIRVADYHIAIPNLDWSVLSEALARLNGSPPTAPLPDAVCQCLSLSDLSLAERPDEGSDGFIRRLKKLLDYAPTPSTDEEGPLLEDFHGIDDAVTWGLTLAADLAEFQAGKLEWRDVDRGVMLSGPPGTGKTSFARALVRTCSARCGAPVGFVSASYAKWQGSGHLGDFIKSMQKDFQAATASAPAIMFIDEIDSFTDRGQLTGDNANYGLQCVNALLEQVDGIGGREGVVLVAATNNAGLVDPALLRPGRLDRVITIGLPDERALEGIFRHHLPGSQLEGKLTDAGRLAHGATGAHVEQWCRSARRRARMAKRNVHVGDLVEEISSSFGPARDDKSRRLTSIHEAGHAYLVALEKPESLGCVSIKVAGEAGGTTSVTFSDEPIDEYGLRMWLRQGLAGRAAELVLLGRISTAAGGKENSDLGRVTAMAVAALTSYGLFDETPRWLVPPAYPNVCQILQWRPDIAVRVERLLAEAHEEAVAAIRSGRGAVQAIADALMVSETLSGPDVLAVIAKHSPIECAVCEQHAAR